MSFRVETYDLPTTSNIFWMEAQWKTDDFCTGIPTTFYLFQTGNPRQPSYFQITDLYHFPLVYDALNYGNPYPFTKCGYTLGYFPSRNDFCCSTSVDLESSGRVHSGADILVTEGGNDLFSILNMHSPSSAAGSKYCLTYSTTDSTNSTGTSKSNLFGFTSALYLNDGNCYNPTSHLNMSASCSQDGVLSIYADTNCTSLERSYLLNSTLATNLSSPTWGEYSAMLFTFESSKLVVGWTSYKPVYKYVRGLKSTWEILAFLCFVMFFTTFVYCLHYEVQRYLKRRTALDLLSVCTITSWLMYGVVDVLVYYLPYPSSPVKLELLIHETLLPYVGEVLLLLSYLLNTIQTTITFHRVYGFTAKYRLLVNLGVAVFFVLFNFGAILDDTLKVVEHLQPMFSSFDYFFMAREPGLYFVNLQAMFVYPMFLWDVVPMNVAFYGLVQKKKNLSFGETVKERAKIDKKWQFRIINSLHLFIMILYSILYTLVYYTFVLQTDANFKGVQQIEVVLIALHGLLKKQLMDAMIAVLITKAHPGGRNVKEKQQMVPKPVLMSVTVAAPVGTPTNIEMATMKMPRASSREDHKYENGR